LTSELTTLEINRVIHFVQRDSVWSPENLIKVVKIFLHHY